jgi:hypothetical protein
MIHTKPLRGVKRDYWHIRKSPITMIGYSLPKINSKWLGILYMSQMVNSINTLPEINHSEEDSHIKCSHLTNEFNNLFTV